MSGAPGSSFNWDDLPKRERVGLASQLIGGTLPSVIAKGAAGLLGASDFTGALAGDAYLPGALGADGEGVPSWGSKIGGRLRDPRLAKSLFGGMAAAQSMHQGERDRTQQIMASFHRPETSGPIKDTILPGLAPVSTYPNPNVAQAQMMDPRDPRYRQWMAMQQGGFGG